MRLKIVLLSAICVFLTQQIIAQDPHFSQIQYNPIYLNPANAGFAKKDNRFAGIYRDQWRTVPIPFSTTHASYDRKIKQWESGWRLGGGLSFLYDRAGDGLLSTFNPNLTLAVGKFFNQEKQLLNVGISSGVTIKNLNYNKLTFDNQYVVGSGYNPDLGSGEVFSNNAATFANFTVGLNFTTQIGKKSSLDIGGTFSNLHQPNQNFLFFSESKLPARYGAYTKAIIGFKKNDNWNVQPGFFYNHQNKVNNILANAIAEVKFKQTQKGKDIGLGFGVGYRAQDNDAAITYLSLLYDNLRVGASYDINVSSFRKATNTVGAFEVALVYEWGESSDKKKKKVDTIYIKELIIETDTVYIQNTDTIIKQVPCDLRVAEWDNKLLKLLPSVVYFDNDIPNPKSLDTTTTENFEDLYQKYLERKPIFAENIGADNAEELFSIVTIEFNKLKEIHHILKEILADGRSVQLQFLGYTSPLANTQYNLNLSKRRTESVKNYFYNMDNGSLKKYIDEGKLLFELLPLGKSMSPQGISDKLTDTKNSVYGTAASLERKVEIRFIIIK